MGTSATEVERLIQAARLHLAREELHEAAGQATEAIRLDGQQPAAYLVRAEAHRRLKRSERALADLAVAIRIDPHQPGPYVIRAEILKRRCQFDQAIADATIALMLDPRNAAAYAIRAQCRYAIGDQEGAREDVQEMLLIDPTRPVPDLRAGAVNDSSSATAADDERFWKQAGGRGDERALFADGKPVDRTYRSRPAVSDEDAPEVLGAASGYKPETATRPIPRMRDRSAISPSRNGLPLILGTATIVAVAVWLALRSDRGSEPSRLPAAGQPSQNTRPIAPEPATASTTHEVTEKIGRSPSAPVGPTDLKPLMRDLGSFSLTKAGRSWPVVMPARFTKAEVAFYRGDPGDQTLNAAWEGHLQINGKDVVRFKGSPNKPIFHFHDYTTGTDYEEVNDYKPRAPEHLLNVTTYLHPGENSFYYYHEQRPDLPMGLVLYVTEKGGESGSDEAGPAATRSKATGPTPESGGGVPQPKGRVAADLPVRAAPELVALAELNTPGNENGLWLSPDGLVIYGVTFTQGAVEGEIWSARRRDPGSLFTDKRLLGHGRHVTVSADGLTMYLVQRRASGTPPGDAIHFATRRTTDEAFGRPQEVAELRSVPAPRNLFLSADGLCLYFNHTPGNVVGLSSATRASTRSKWGRPLPVAVTWPGGIEKNLLCPFVTADGLKLYGVMGERTGDPRPRFAIWSRKAADQPFSNPAFLTLPGVDDFSGWYPRPVEATREVFFNSQRLSTGGGLDLWLVRNFKP